MKLFNRAAVLIMSAQVISPNLQPLEIQEHQIRAANAAGHENEDMRPLTGFIKFMCCWTSTWGVIGLIKSYVYNHSAHQQEYFHIHHYLSNHSAPFTLN